jgi:hypothetical protein
MLGRVGWRADGIKSAVRGFKTAHGDNGEWLSKGAGVLLSAANMTGV